MNWKRAGRQIVLLLVLAAGVVTPAVAAAQQSPPKPAQDEFVAVDQLPQEERVPAARLLIIAYAVAWIVVAGYLFSIWQRLGRVERELAEATRRLPATQASPPDDRARR